MLTSNIPESVINQVASSKPFTFLTTEEFSYLRSNSKVVDCPLGTRILEPAFQSDSLYLLLSGKIRFLAKSNIDNTLFTFDTRGAGQLIGFSTLIAPYRYEYVQTAQDSILLALPGDAFSQLYESNPVFKDFFYSLNYSPEIAFVLGQIWSKLFIRVPSEEQSWLIHSVKSTIKCTHSLPRDHIGYQLFGISHSGEVVHYPHHSSIEDVETSDFVAHFLVKDEYVVPYIYGDSNDADHSELSFTSSPAPDITKLHDYHKNNLHRDAHNLLNSFVSIAPFDYDNKESSRGYLRTLFSEILAEFNVAPQKDFLNSLLNTALTVSPQLPSAAFVSILERLSITANVFSIPTPKFPYLDFPCIVRSPSKAYIYIKSKHGAIYSCFHPILGPCSLTLEQLIDPSTDSSEIISIYSTSSTVTNVFNLGFFLPLIRKYSVSLVLVFFASFAAQSAGLAIPLLIQQIIDKTIQQGNLTSLNFLGATLILLALFQAFLMALRTFIFKDTTDRMDIHLGTVVIDKLLKLPLSYYDQRPVGELSQRLGEMTNVRNFMTGTALTSVLDIVFSLFYIIVMFLYSPLLSLVALSTLPVYIVILIFVAPIYKSLIRSGAVAQAKTQSHIIEVLTAIQTVKAQSLELTSRWKWQDLYKQVIHSGFKAATVSVVTGQLGGVLNQISSLLIIWVGMHLILKGELTLGMLIAFRIIAGNVTSPLLRLSNLYQSYQEVSLSLDRLSDIANRNSEGYADTSQLALPPVTGHIDFRSVFFTFPGTQKPILTNLSFVVEPKTFVGLVGLSGSGKTTVLKLLTRLYEPSSGIILLDGYDINKVSLSTVRSQIGFVPQDSYLFEGTVRDNLTLTASSASDEQIINSTTIACAHDFIMSLPNGYSTVLSERGSNLSGGQRQRIVIARTLLAKPSLLVFDEATSALDVQTESSIIKNLQTMLPDTTILFVTHRLTSLTSANHVIYMENGSVVEQGSHPYLIAKNGPYSALYAQQAST